MAAAKADKDDKKSFDIKKPGKSAPSASSRPIIVKHAPMMQDPMFSEGANAQPSSAPEVADDKGASKESESLQTASTSAVRKKIVPIHELDDTSADGPAKVTTVKDTETDNAETQTKTPDESVSTEDSKEVTDLAIVEKAVNDDTSPAAEEPTKPPEALDATEANESEELEAVKSSDSAAVDALAGKVGTTSKDKQAAEEAARQEAVAKLIADKTYFVTPGKSHQQKGVNLVVVLALFLLLLLIGAYLAVDAGMLDLGFDLPYEFIQN